MGTSLQTYLAEAEANDGAASLALARRLDVAERTWRRWRDGPHLDAIVRGAAGLTGQVTSRTLLRAHLDAIGEGALLGGRSALWALHGARDDGPCRTPQPLEIALDHDLHHRSHKKVHVRRSRNLRPEDVVTANGWPCTSAAFTGMDLVDRLDDDAGLALLIDMIFHRLVTPDELLARALATPTALGAKRTARLVEPLVGERSDSIFEWLVRRAVEALGLLMHPGPYKVQTDDGTFEVDIALLELKISIECNGASHLEGEQQARDDRKRNALLLADWVPLSITYNDFIADPEAFLAQVRRAIRIQRRRLGL